MRVADTGPGLDPGDGSGRSPRVVHEAGPRRAAARAGARARRAGGAPGGGTVGVERGDPGAVFVVTLPVRERGDPHPGRRGRPGGAAAHAEYVGRVPGFEVVAEAPTGAEALRVLARGGVDLVLLDVHLPDTNGLEVLRRMRAAGNPTDVIMVTSARDLAVVRTAVAQGVVQYLLKPFTSATLRAKLERYPAYRDRVAAGTAGRPAGGRRPVDGLRAPVGEDALPKTVSRETLDSRSPRCPGRRALGGRARGGPRGVPGDRAAVPGAPDERAWPTGSPVTAARAAPNWSTASNHPCDHRFGADPASSGRLSQRTGDQGWPPQANWAGAAVGATVGVGVAVAPARRDAVGGGAWVVVGGGAGAGAANAFCTTWRM